MVLPGLLEDLDIAKAEKVEAFVKTLDKLLGISGKSEGYQGLLRQIRLCLDLTRHKHPRLFGALNTLKGLVHRQLKEGIATHLQKRTLVYQLHLAQKNPKSLADLVSGSPFDPDAPKGSIMNPLIVWRRREMSFGPPLRTVLADTRCRPNSGDFISDDAAGFYRVGADESVIFVDKDGYGKTSLHLCVLRQVFGNQSAQAEAILRWFQHTIDNAVTERRDVRPTHDGRMVQIGWNAGPRHARVFGLAKSFTKNLDEETKTAHDHDAIAAANIVWGAAKTWLPTDVTNGIDAALSKTGMPRIATRNVSEGTGFCLQLEGQKYLFPHYERAPPEAYLTRDYSSSLHKDPCYISGPSAISLNVGRSVDPLPASFPSAAPSSASLSQTRPRRIPGHNVSTNNTLAENPSLWPADGGGHFVDMSLKVVVEQAAGTLLNFDSTKPHGTTRLCGAHNYTVSITFSAHIMAAFEKAKIGMTDAGEGAGDGNHD
ncbi:hypothetical protein GGX14DRAFT_603942 [Mycena pura]|uniref:Uncharacterized protein n=1 Tax=Mycena pura TaxID=153505 RepID=A0AAD6Y052_9AGAR|nr:hypothetical protein GGX14DRAFT_603942 [Mycena pura]